ncbi:hypothetical protein [Nocardia otitidiscaviarum]|uniref:hypothetical protein n=1 Tax=Nocardia otitidiscaviarum TaxID=1823 RepID=UPI0018937796|nr:hypothetical protein [Nocardia otitidiscaviarum]MBF6183388.1 hypothetical protein [Nocardia otitidiscaviarum]
MTDYLNDLSAVTRWLDTHRDQFYAELALRLDIEAGLEEVLLAERHNGLVEEIRDKLDIEAGLANILPPPPVPLPEAAQQPHTPGSLEWASAELSGMSLQTRLALRGDYAEKLGFAAREITTLACTQAGIAGGQFDAAATRIRQLLDRGDRDREVRLRAAQAIAAEKFRFDDHLPESQKESLLSSIADQIKNQGCSDLLDEIIADEVTRAAALNTLSTGAEKTGQVIWLRDFNVQWPHPRSEGLESERMLRWRDAVADYVGTSLDSMYEGLMDRLDRIDDLKYREGANLAALHHMSAHLGSNIIAELTELASQLLLLEQMLNDFIGADLRNVELTGVPLEGLRWSEQTTQWPNRWHEQIKQYSVHLEDDVYEIHYGTHARGKTSLV